MGLAISLREIGIALLGQQLLKGVVMTHHKQNAPANTGIQHTVFLKMLINAVPGVDEVIAAFAHPVQESNVKLVIRTIAAILIRILQNIGPVGNITVGLYIGEIFQTKGFQLGNQFATGYVLLGKCAEGAAAKALQ